MGHVAYDQFIRTTDAKHVGTVQSLWRRLEKSGFIYKGTHEGWYSVADETFYTDAQVQKDHDDEGREVTVSIETGRQVERVSEPNYMFRLSKFQQPLLAWLKQTPSVIQPEIRGRDIVSWLQSVELQDLSISRPTSRQSWGIGVPNDHTQSIYVWFDALINYLTVTGYSDKWTTDGTEYGFPVDTHIVGKDILRFHSIYWPAILMAAGLPLPRRIVAHGHWTVERVKMSKSLNNVVNPKRLVNTYGIDATRYFLLRDGSLDTDGDFSEDLLRLRYQVELADQLGNLLSRCLSKALNPNLCMPQFNIDVMSEQDRTLWNSLDSLVKRVAPLYDACDFAKGSALVFDQVRAVNQYLAQIEPWKLMKMKDEASQKTALNSLFFAIEAVRICSLMLQPVMPDKSKVVLDNLAVPDLERSVDHAHVHSTSRKFAQHKVILFPRLPKPASSFVKEK